MTDIQIPGFEIVEKLGIGGMATVWKARQLSLDRVVAIKILSSRLATDSADVERFESEAKSAARLKHAGIVQVYDANVVNGLYYFVMEFVAGYTVGDWLGRKGALPARDALLIADCVADALGYAWENARIIHCDIKPDNVMVDADGTVKVADLGLARTMTAMNAERADDEVWGTPPYMSPEQVSGGADLDARSDMYAVGAMLYHCVTGRPLFEGQSAGRTMEMQITETVEDPMDVDPSVPVPLAWLIEKLLAKKRDQRPPTWPAVRADIARAQRGLPPAGERLPEGVSTVRRSARRVHVPARSLAAVAAPDRGMPAAAIVFIVLIAIALAGVVLYRVAERYRGDGTPAVAPEAEAAQEGAQDDAAAEEARLRGLYEQAVIWGQENPDHHLAAIEKLEAVAQEARGTPYEDKAREQIERLVAGRRKRARATMAEVRRQAADAIKKRDFREAARVFEDYRGPLAEDTSGERRREAAHWREQAETEERKQAEANAPPPRPPPVRPGRVMEEMTDALFANGPGAAHAVLEQYRNRLPAGVDTRVLGGLGGLLQRAVQAERRALESLAEPAGQTARVTVHGRECEVTVTGVDGDRASGVYTDESGLRKQVEFELSDLRLEERLRRLGRDEEPEVALVKALIACDMSAYGRAREYLLRLPRPLAERLLEKVDELARGQSR